MLINDTNSSPLHLSPLSAALCFHYPAKQNRLDYFNRRLIANFNEIISIDGLCHIDRLNRSWQLDSDPVLNNDSFKILCLVKSLENNIEYINKYEYTNYIG